MKNIKDELQHIIFSDGPVGQEGNLKKVQNFLRGYKKAKFGIEKQQFLKSKEATVLIDFAEKIDLIYSNEISEDNFISAGAEQRVYKYDDFCIIKTNSSIFYEQWLELLQ